MQTLFEVLFLLSMFVPAGAVVVAVWARTDAAIMAAIAVQKVVFIERLVEI